MRLFRQLRRVLNAPFPINRSVSGQVASAVVLALCVVVFLNVFQPFGLSEVQHPHRHLILSLFGLPTLLGTLLCTRAAAWLFRNRPDHQWRVWMHLLVGVCVIIAITLGNFVLISVLAWSPMGLQSLLQMLGYTLSMAFLPWTAAVIIDWVLLLRRHETLARVLNEHLANPPQPPAATAKDAGTPPDAAPVGAAQLLTVSGENRDEVIRIDPERITYISAEGNYVELHFESAPDREMCQLLRSSLSRMEELLAAEAGYIVRVHRSYMVNLRRIEHSEGNAQGLTLRLRGAPRELPVSRSYIRRFRELMQVQPSAPAAPAPVVRP